jgi:predicted dehydrogenase
MSAIYRTGLVGAGFAEKAHLPALLAHPRFDVVAIASPHSAARIARARKIPHSFTSCGEMVRGVELDAVVIASPPFAHCDDVHIALEKKLNVLCEKPFALSVAQAERMLAASQNAGTACGVVHEFRWVPQRQALKELIVNGHLDPLREIEITELGSRLRRGGDRANSWWFERKSGGGIGGALLSHIIDTANWLAARPPQRAVGFLRTANPERRDAKGPFTTDVDDGAFALFDYGDGVVGRLSVDATIAVDSFTLAAHAENRTAVASGPNAVEQHLFSVDENETAELQCKPSPYARFASVGANVPLLMELYDAFVTQIETGSSTLPTFAEAVETQRALAAIGYGS